MALDAAGPAVPALNDEPSFSDGEQDGHDRDHPDSHADDSAQLGSSRSSEEVAAAIRKQVEFYFSDTNLPTDKHMLKQIAKDPDGFVPIKFIAGFKRIKAITKDLSVIAAALSASPQLLVSEDAKRVRRVEPLPEFDIAEVQRRTVLAEHLPDGPTIESVTQLFAPYGTVRMVRLCLKGNSGNLPSWLHSTAINVQHGPVALVEFSSEKEAAAAVAAFVNPDNWRTSLRVRTLQKSSAKQASSKASSRADDAAHGGSSRRGSETGEGSRSHTPTPHSSDLPLPSLPAIRTTSAAAAAAAAAMSGSSAGAYVPPHGSPTRTSSALNPANAAVGSPRRAHTPSSPSRTNSNANGGASLSAPPTPLVNTPPAGLAAFIDKILLGPTNPRAPGSGTASPRISGSGNWGSSGGSGSNQGSPKAAGATPGSTRAPTRMASGAAAALAAAAAAAAASVSVPRTGSGAGRPKGASDSGGTPNAAAPGSASKDSAVGNILGASSPGMWGHTSHMPSAAQVDAHFGPSRSDRAGAGSGGGAAAANADSDDPSSSASKPPRVPGSAGRQRRQSWHPTTTEEVSALTTKLPASKLTPTRSSLKDKIEAIREASSELDPALAAAAIATLSGTASAAAAAATAGGLTVGSRQRRSSYSEGGVPAENGSAAGGKKKGGGKERVSEDGGGEGEEGEGKRRRGRQRRKSTGSRRTSLDMADPAHASNSSPDEDAKPRGAKATATPATKPAKKDYAAWAAATPEFRAEAASMKHPGARGGSATPPYGTPPRMSFMQNAGALAGRNSPIRFMSVGAETAAAAAAHAAEAARQPRMPDGTRGFGMGRGKAMATP